MAQGVLARSQYVYAKPLRAEGMADATRDELDVRSRYQGYEGIGGD